MPHKYLNAIGISSKDPGIFNTEWKENDKQRRKRFKKQRKKYGFDERETWQMDFTLATWIYEHFIWYKKHSIVDLTFHTFEIPQWDKETNTFSETNLITVHQKDAIDIVLKNIRYYLKYADSIDLDKADKAYKKFEYAFRIMGVLMPSMWW